MFFFFLVFLFFYFLYDSNHPHHPHHHATAEPLRLTNLMIQNARDNHSLIIIYLFCFVFAFTILCYVSLESNNQIFFLLISSVRPKFRISYKIDKKSIFAIICVYAFTARYTINNISYTHANRLRSMNLLNILKLQNVQCNEITRNIPLWCWQNKIK